MDYKEKFETILSQYKQQGKPVFVDFKQLVNSIKFTERTTHSIHPYTAKLLANIPYFFFNNSYFVKPGCKILDPFCGSGTVLLEAKLAGLNSYGSDANPLARLITRVKCNNFDLIKIQGYKEEIEKKINDKEAGEIFSYKNLKSLEFWFEKHIQLQLNSIHNAILEISDITYREFFLLCFSNCVRKVSNADSRISVPVKINPSKYAETSQHRIKCEKKLEELKVINVTEKYFDIVNQNIKRIKNKINLNTSKYIGKVISNDCRKLSNLRDESIDLILTSPPYAGAQKYIRASSLNLYWLGYTNLNELDRENIGRENYKKDEYKVLKKTGIKGADYLLQKIFDINPLRAYIAANYLIEMTAALQESARVLKKNGHLILIASNNMVCGFNFNTQEYLKDILLQLGFTIVCEMVDDIKSYGLMTKRNKTASIITCEHILIFKKNG